MAGTNRSSRGSLKIHTWVAVSGTGAITFAGEFEGTSANAVYLGASGTIVFTTEQGALTLANLVAGIWHPMPNYTAITNLGTATGVIAAFSP